MSLGPKVIITPFGGHATETIKKVLRGRRIYLHQRPDYIFSESINSYDIQARPDPKKEFYHGGRAKGYWTTVGAQWERRSSVKLNPIVSIHNNLLRLINTTDRKVLLFGKCSLVEPFLTNNEIEALCMIRHPLYAYNSFLVRRHPQWGEKAGGVNSMQCAEWYVKKWKAVVDDFISSGNPIVYYETLIEDLNKLGYTELAAILEPIWKPRREELSVTEIDVVNYLNKLDYIIGGERWKQLGY